MEVTNRHFISLDVAQGTSTEVLNVWLEQDGKRVLRYSEDLYKLRATFAPQCERLGMTFEQFVQLAAQYAELAVMMQECYEIVFGKPHNAADVIDVMEFCTAHLQFCVRKDLSDAQLFMCALLDSDDKEYGLTTPILKELFDWTRYKARKVAASVQGKQVVTLINEDREGYFGKGWMLDNAVRKFVNLYKDAVIRKTRTNDAQGSFCNAPDKV